MALPTTGSLTMSLIADEVGYSLYKPYFLAGPTLSSGTTGSPGLTSLSYFFRPGAVFTSGVRQGPSGFSMSAFYGQEALYNCVAFRGTASAGSNATGSATFTSYYKNKQTVIFLGATPSSYCVRQLWNGQLDISNITNVTYSASVLTGCNKTQNAGSCTSSGIFTLAPNYNITFTGVTDSSRNKYFPGLPLGTASITNTNYFYGITGPDRITVTLTSTSYSGPQRYVALYVNNVDIYSVAATGGSFTLGLTNSAFAPTPIQIAIQTSP